MKHIKIFEEYSNEKFNLKKTILIGSALGALAGNVNATTNLNTNFNDVNKNIKIDNLYQSVVNAIRENQIQAARDLVSTTDEENVLYNFIRKNEIQAARNYLSNSK